MTIKEIKAKLVSLNIKFNNKMNKAALEALLPTNTDEAKDYSDRAEQYAQQVQSEPVVQATVTTELEKCPHCGGSGYRPDIQTWKNREDSAVCYWCNGTGSKTYLLVDGKGLSAKFNPGNLYITIRKGGRGPVVMEKRCTSVEELRNKYKSALSKGWYVYGGK